MFRQSCLTGLVLALMMAIPIGARSQSQEIFVITGVETYPSEGRDIRERVAKGRLNNVSLLTGLLILLDDDFEVDGVGADLEKKLPLIDFTSGLPLRHILDEVCRSVGCVWWLGERTFYVRDFPATGQDLARLWSEAGVGVEVGRFASEPVPGRLVAYDLSDPAKIASQVCATWGCKPQYDPSKKRLRFLPR